MIRNGRDGLLSLRRAGASARAAAAAGGGSVTACRLTEKGYTVAVMEMGRIRRKWKA